jgi:hypothetical protein
VDSVLDAAFNRKREEQDVVNPDVETTFKECECVFFNNYKGFIYLS